MYTLWKNEEVYDAGFETKKQQKHEALAARDNNLIAQIVSQIIKEKTCFLTQYL
jgi:hypothetical protein